jgi:hypothetical protein
MTQRLLATLTLLLLASIPMSAQRAEEPTMLNDAESAKYWSNGVQTIADGYTGQAIRYAIPNTGKPTGCTVDLKHIQTPITKDQRLVFRYRLSGTGRTTLHIKLMDPIYAKGWQATWEIGAGHEPDGEWHQASVDLSTKWMQWGETPVMGTRNLNFRTQAAQGSDLTLDLDDIQLVPKCLTAQVGRIRVSEKGAVTIGLKVANVTKAQLAVVATSGNSRASSSIPAGGQSSLELTVGLPKEWLATAHALDQTHVQVAVEAEKSPWSRLELTVPVAMPLDLPPHPRLLMNASDVKALRQRIETIDWVKGLYEGEKRNAERMLTESIELPPRGGQWWHWYACKKDGGRLKTVSPTEHECPVCGTVYSGWPYDDVVLDRDHNRLARGLRSLGIVYQMTGEEKYAARGREILMAYAERYTTYPLHNIHGKDAIGGGRVGPQTLDESTWLIPMCQGADLIWSTLSDADREKAASGLFRPAAQVIRQHRMSIHNIQCWKNSAVGLVGLLLGDDNLVADAVASPHGFKAQIAKGISADGQWYEGAWGYHFYTVAAILPLIEAGERCGLELYAYTSDGRSYRRLFDGPLDLAMPTLRLPAFNDSGTVDLRGQAQNYEYALGRFGAPRYAEVIDAKNRKGLGAMILGANPLPPPPADSRGSRNFLASGYAILEHGTGTGATWVCLKYGPHGGGHGHPDKLNVSLCAQGVLLGLDPGTAAYGVPIQKEWFRATLAHNTLTVDEASQKPTEGRCLGFGTDAQREISGAIAEAGDIYPGVTYRRATALFGEDLVVLVDLVQADSEHTFDLAWHNAGKWATPPQGTSVTPPSKPGYMHLTDMVRATGALPLVNATDKVKVGIATAMVGDGEVWAGRGFNSRKENRPVAIIQRTKGKTAVVAWAISLRGGAVPVLEIAGTPENAQVVATVDGRAYRLQVSPAGKVPLVLDGPQGKLPIAAQE